MTLLPIEGTTAFAVYETGICAHCSEAIERRRLLGWLHVDAFFLCAAQPNDVRELTTADPRSHERRSHR